MSEEYKKRVTAALLRNSAKHLKLLSPKKKNSKPEKLVEAACLTWMRQRQWDVDIYEAKAVYNKNAGRYVSSAMKAGVSDCMGMSADGFAVYIEFKAKGRLSTFAAESNERQKTFLISKINFGAFACVVDCVELLEAYYLQWMRRRLDDVASSKTFLLDQLPRLKKDNSLDFDL